MKKILLQFLFIALSFQSIICQTTEDFEDETDNTTSFTEPSGGTFTVTGDFEIQIGGPFGAGGTNGWLDTGAGNDPTPGSAGEIQASGATISFTLTGLAAWTSSDDAGSENSGNVTFRGTPVGGGADLVETILVDPPNISTYDVVTFTGALNGAAITALEVDLTGSGLNYIGIDNIVFTETILPVELMRFSGKKADNSFVLSWRTASELNNAGFEVQRSTDASNFHKIGWLQGAGNASAINDYSFEDKDLQDNQVYYYRLKQVDHDGRFEYSSALSFINTGEGATTVKDISPNPISADFADLRIISPSQQAAEVTMFDGIGKLVFEKKTNLIKGMHTIRINLNDAQAGVHYVRVSLENGETYFKKLVVAAR